VSNWSYYLPPKMVQPVAGCIERCPNPALVLEKYIPQEVINHPENKNDSKSRWLNEAFIRNDVINRDLARNAYVRWQAMLHACQAISFDAALEWRIVVGLGGNEVLETGLTLRHLYGLPIIPGSALKGLTRAYAAGEEERYFVSPSPEAERPASVVETKAEQPVPSLKTETDHPDIKRIFGTQEEPGSSAAGTAIFFDALPVNGQCSFVVDIMTPHYKDYCRSLASERIEAPSNDQSPVPIPFLAVKETSFTFAVAPRNPGNPQHREDANTAVELLKKALSHYGVGGKTSAGYGYFSVPEQQKAVDAPSDPEVKSPLAAPHIRPNIPTFVAGQGISGVVVPPTYELRLKYPEAKAFLKFQDFPVELLLVIIETEEEIDWSPGQSKNCLLVREVAHEECTVLVCRPGKTKKKKKG
jgi:CRISPR type III-B/RAMP module RAMP protein Cmr6